MLPGTVAREHDCFPFLIVLTLSDIPFAVGLAANQILAKQKAFIPRWITAELDAIALTAAMSKRFMKNASGHLQ